MRTMKYFLTLTLLLTTTLSFAKLPSGLSCTFKDQDQRVVQVTLLRLNSPGPTSSFKGAPLVEYTRDDQGLFLRFSDQQHNDYALSFTLGDLQRLEDGERFTIAGTLEYYQVEQHDGVSEQTVALNCRKIAKPL